MDPRYLAILITNWKQIDDDWEIPLKENMSDEQLEAWREDNEQLPRHVE